HAYHDPAERAQAIGIWAAATGVAVAAGPVVGGILTHAWTWRSVFLVNLPVGVLGIVLTLRHVPPVPPQQDGDFDLTAQALGVAGLLGLALVSARASLVSVVGPMLAVGMGASLAMPAMTHAAIDHTPKERAGIGSAVLNASRQVGGVVGIALLGALISSHERQGATAHFVAGLHEGLALAGVLFLVGSVLSLVFVD